MELLKDKITLVTGGSRGIGRRTALLFAEEGATVIFTDIQENDASRETLSELQKFSPKSMFIASNAADYEETLKVAEIVQKEHPPKQPRWMLIELRIISKAGMGPRFWYLGCGARR